MSILYALCGSLCLTFGVMAVAGLIVTAVGIRNAPYMEEPK